MSDTNNIPQKMRLPDEIRNGVIKRALAAGLDPAPLIEAWQWIYILGFYDGAADTLHRPSSGGEGSEPNEER